MVFADTLGYAWERRLCYIEAEDAKAVGWIAKAPQSDVKRTMLCALHGEVGAQDRLGCFWLDLAH